MTPLIAALRQWFVRWVFFVIERGKVSLADSLAWLAMSFWFTVVTSFRHSWLYQRKDMRLIHYSCLELRWGAGMIELLGKEFFRHAVHCLRNQWLRTVSFIIDFIDIDVSWQKIVLALEFDWRRVYIHVCVTYIYWSSLLLWLDHITLRFEWNLWLVTCNILLMRLVLFPPSSWVGFAWLSDCLACLCAVDLQLRC